MEEQGSFCYPSQLKDIIIMVLFPPLWVLLKEIYSKKPLSNIIRVVFNFLFTSLFYFPGLIHAMKIFRNEGGI
jgi:uncharacterized membrane protein YqaE (UPF0057 family)